MTNNRLLINHQKEGKYIEIGTTRAFVLEKGKGVPVLCFHGVPSSSFLYRKIIDRLAGNNLRGISFDLLGMGLSSRPEHYDYTWTGLGIWCSQVIENLDLGQFHVVLHDIGGPIACEVMANIPDRIKSVTILNTILINFDVFKKPFPMQFFAMKGIGELFLSMTNPFFFQQLMHMRGINRNEIFGREEAEAYVSLLKGDDGGKAFLKIMRGFEATEAKQQYYLQTLRSLPVPKQMIWGVNDRALPIIKYGEPLQEELGIFEIERLDAAHFLQEDYSDSAANKIIELTDFNGAN